MKIYVCSPYGGKAENYLTAVEYCRQVAANGHIPFASHVLLHDVLQEPEGRKMGLEAGLIMVDLCDEVWVFGGRITEGMCAEIAWAQVRGTPIRFLSGGEVGCGTF